MPATVLQSVAKAVSGGAATTVAIAPGSATSATGLLLAFGTARAAFAATPVTDTGGRTWSPVSAVIFTGTSGLNYGLWTAPTGAGGDTPTVTIHGASSNWIQGCLVECAGCDTSTTPISVSATHSQTTSGTTLTLGPTATCGANEAAVSFVGCDGASTFTAPVGWATVTQQGSLVVGVSNLSVNNQTITAVWTVSANDNVGGIIVSVKAASGVATPSQGLVSSETPGIGLGTPGSRLRGSRGYTTAVAVPIAATGASVSSATAALTGAGVLTATGVAPSAAIAALTGSAELNATGASVSTATANLLGSAAMAASGATLSVASVSLTATGALAVSAVSLSTAQAALTGAGALKASGASITTGQATLTGSGSIVATGAAVSSAVVIIQGLSSGSIFANGAAVSSGRASITGTGALAAAGATLSDANVSLTGAGALNIRGASISVASVTLTGTSPGILAASGASISSATVSLAGAGRLTATGSGLSSAMAALTGSGAITARGVSASAATVILTALQPGPLGARGASLSSAYVMMTDGTLRPNPCLRVTLPSRPFTATLPIRPFTVYFEC